MRVAVVHDWLYVLGGAERVLGEILQCYPQAHVFSLFDVLPPADRAVIGIARETTSFLQNAPFVGTHHRFYLPLMPLAIEQFDLSAYDLVISSSFATAKGVLTGPDQIHISYVHSPMRYAWDMQHQYLRDNGFEKGMKGAVARILLHYLRIWDARTANGPDVMVANSQFVARRIEKSYGRKAKVIYPPVTLGGGREVLHRPYFLTASRLVPYKNVEAIVRAFADLEDLQLIVAGDGPEAARLRRMATENVSFEGFVSDERLRYLMASARAFVFAAEEDFGIVVVEAMSEGTPVLALDRGGARESVSASEPRSGMFFANATPADIAACIRKFVAEEDRFSRTACRRQAQNFSAERFRREFKDLVDRTIADRERGKETNWTPAWPMTI
ncbi:glycosyl transferase [Methylosinus sp. C49]|uniref:glycosyltransferase n=1 Tax=Methylosinus sp. C49 TaxID=2699395 RepID=UPI0013671322|nr:glycosyltransferase [Methylosinus sp. C49]BBU62165.1 glycosyl transferase [Methylosinus sp. C49]